MEETTTQSKEMAPVGQVFSSFPTQAEWNTLNVIAKTLKEGGVLPKGIDTVQKMVVALQAGREIGLQPIEAMNCLYFVNGKVSMYGEAVPNQIIRAGHTIKWGECNAQTATVTITRGDNGDSMTQIFTMQDAIERGYTSNPIYKKYPENMLKWKALGMIAKFLCPDALRGIGIKEEMESEVVQEDSPFSNKKEGEKIKGEIVGGSYGERKPLNAVLDEPEEQPEPQDAGVEEPEGYQCDECGQTCKSQGGLTIHMKSHE